LDCRRWISTVRAAATEAVQHCTAAFAPRTNFGPLQSDRIKRHLSGRGKRRAWRNLSMRQKGKKKKSNIRIAGHPRATGSARRGGAGRAARASRTAREKKARGSASISTIFDFSRPWDYYEKHGEDGWPEDWKAKIGKHDAILFRRGRNGPRKIPDHISLWGSLIKFRREFDQYVQSSPGAADAGGCRRRLANRKPGDIDFWVGARKHRRRIFIRRRADVPRYRNANSSRSKRS